MRCIAESWGGEMIWLYIYYAIAFVAFFVLCVIGYKNEMRKRYTKDPLSSDDIFNISVLALLFANGWPLVVVVAIGYGFLKLLQWKRGEA